MKVLVLGAGVIGVTSAYYLAKAGHEVTVIDRQPGPALETSYANAGEVSPGYASPRGRTRHPLEGYEVAVHAARAARAAAKPRPSHVALDVPAGPELHSREIRRQ